MELSIYISGDEVRKSDLWKSNNDVKQAKAFLHGSQIADFIDGLAYKAQVDFFQKLGGLRIGNKDTSGTNFKQWEDDVYEVRFFDQYRLFFLLWGEQCILLYSCHKQKNKTEKKDCKNIRKRAKIVQKLLGISGKKD